jgi:CPA2 family monovalent cation:H+ antiporter-2
VDHGLDIAFYKTLLIALAASAVLIPLIQRLRLPAVLGYMLVGVVVGPFGVGAVLDDIPGLAAMHLDDPKSLASVAELGVALLMFMIGLELSPERLWLMRRLVLGLGGAQFTLSAVAGGVVAHALGLAWAGAVAIGLAVAMSSTAVVLQALAEQKRLNTTVGRAAFATLLAQDIAVVPVLFALVAMAPASGVGGIDQLAFAIGVAVTGALGIAALGWLIVRPLFRAVVRQGDPESFVAACLLVVVACGVAAVSTGLSMALGALIGGLLLAGTEYRRQVEATIAPFKGLLVGMFLISIGMSLNLAALIRDLVPVLLTAVALLAAKAAIVVAAARVLGLSWRHGLHVGLLLGPGGEFGFVIIAGAADFGLLPQGTAKFALLVVALTMALIPLLSHLGGRVSDTPRAARVIDPALMPPGDDDTRRVVIAGFGRVGQMVADMLRHHDVPYIALDRDPDRVAWERRRDPNVYYGDLTRPELLRHLGVDHARALVVTVNDPDGAVGLARAARVARADLVIVARARDADHAARLYAAGATDAVPETIEASLQLAEAVLVELAVPMGPIIVSIHEKRTEMQNEIKKMAPDAEIRPRGRHRVRDMRS